MYSKWFSSPHPDKSERKSTFKKEFSDNEVPDFLFFSTYHSHCEEVGTDLKGYAPHSNFKYKVAYCFRGSVHLTIFSTLSLLYISTNRLNQFMTCFSYNHCLSYKENNHQNIRFYLLLCTVLSFL